MKFPNTLLFLVTPASSTTASSTLNRPIRLRYIAEDVEATRPIQIIASQVVPHMITVDPYKKNMLAFIAYPPFRQLPA